MKMEIFNLDPKSRYHIDDFNLLNCKDIFFLHTFNDDLLKCIFSPFFRWRIFQFSMAFFHYFSNTNFFFRHFSWKHISWRVISKKNQIDSIFSSRDIEIYIKKGKFLFSGFDLWSSNKKFLPSISSDMQPSTSLPLSWHDFMIAQCQHGESYGLLLIFI